jgi:hypothetical protein
MPFSDLLKRFTGAVEAADGPALAALFTPNGVYHDTFYGEFAGREAISRMLTEYFWRDAEAFEWDMTEPVSDGRLGYARWTFGYTSKLPESRGRRVAFAGMSRFLISDGAVVRYDEAFNAGLAFAQLDMPPERIARILRRVSDATLATEPIRGHLARHPRKV